MLSCYSEFIQNNYDQTDRIGLMTIQQGVKNSITTAESLAASADKQEEDSYMAMNPLGYKGNCIQRDKAHVSRLKWLYVDLDYYHTPYKEFSKKQIVGLLELDYFGQKLPIPTYIIDSGRGIYLLWKINEHIKAYPRWSTMQKYLCNTLKEFGSDPKVASDSARVLRRIGSINSKSGSVVSAMQHNNVQYSLTNLMRQYVQEELPSPKMIDYAKGIAKVLDIEAPDMQDRQAVRKFIQANKEPANLISQMQRVKKQQEKKKRAKIVWMNNSCSMDKSRLKDLEILLLEHRDREAGCREYILFLYRYWTLCLTDDKNGSLQKALELNKKLKNPLDEKEVITATKSAEKYYDAGKVYKPSNGHIIEALHITKEEMKDMCFFIDAAEKRERKKQRSKEAYSQRLKMEGKSTKKHSIKKRLVKVYKLLQMGRMQQEICSMLHISKSTYYNDVKCIENFSDEQLQEILCELKADKPRPARFHWGNKHAQEQEGTKKVLHFPNFSALKLYKSFRTLGCPLWGMIPVVKTCLLDYWDDG